MDWWQLFVIWAKDNNFKADLLDNLQELHFTNEQISAYKLQILRNRSLWVVSLVLLSYMNLNKIRFIYKISFSLAFSLI